MIADTVERNVRMNGMADGVDFSIDSQDMGTLADILSDKLYSDKPLAVIREYICNAIDAHAEVGSDRQVEITPPSELAPTFIIRDFGRGLSPEDVHNIYVKFCKSTKRDSNTQIGTFGLGCKAGFAYSDSFTVTSWFEGTMNVYTAQKMADRRLKMIPVHSSKSDAPSGIQISISVRQNDVYTFRKKLSEFCKYIENRPKFPEGFTIPDLTYSIRGEGFAIEEYSGGWRGCKVLMGNVTYPIDMNQIDSSFSNSSGVVIFANIGDVSVAPDREKLEYTDKTIGFLNERFSGILETIKKNAQEEINKQETLWGALRVIREINSSISGVSLVLDQFTFKGRKLSFKSKALVYSRRRSTLNPYFDHPVSLHEVDHQTVLVVCDPAESIRVKRLAKGIYESRNFNPDKFIVSNDPEIFKGLFCDTWPERQIVRDYKSLWAKPEYNGRSAASVWFYENLRSRRGYRMLESQITERTYVVMINAHSKEVSEEDRKYVDAARALGIQFYGVLNRNVKKISSDWKPLKDVVDARVATMLAEYKSKKGQILFGEKWDDSVSGYFGSILTDFSEQFKKYDAEIYGVYEDWRKSQVGIANYSTSPIVAACASLGIPLCKEFEEKSCLEKIAKAQAFQDKYSLLFKLFSHNRYRCTGEWEKELKDYVDILNKK